MSVCINELMIEKQSKIRGRLLAHEPLAKYTSWRVGGPAQVMFMPEDRADLINFLHSEDVVQPLFWLGLGSNLLVRDGGIKGTVIYTRGRLRHMQVRENGLVTVEAGVPCAHVARFCGDKGLSGAEFLAGIPGTMGGALKMNAGAFAGETWRIVDSVEMVNSAGSVLHYAASRFNVAYRSVKIPEPLPAWFLSASLKLQSGDSAESQQRVRELLALRSQTQPTNQPSCGSVFKNPPGDHAARLIEQSGLKGLKIGGAQVSEKHANFIINTGQATAADIEQLLTMVAAKVKQKFGVQLQTEVCIVGETV